MKINGEVTVLYKPSDPKIIEAPNSKYVPYIVMGVGIVGTLVFTVKLFRSLRY